MTNVVAAEEIGNLVGSFMEAGVGADGVAMGKFLRVKIRMNIDKPLMRGFMLDDAEEGGRQKQKKKMNIDGGGEEEEGAWCRFEYEFLPEFCYVCGMVGHSERACDMHLDKNRRAQFGGWLRADMSRREASGDESRSWRGRGRGLGVARPFGSSRLQEKMGSGSDGLSWRKESSRSTEGRSGDAEKGEEVTSSGKQNAHALRESGQPKKLQLVAHGGGEPDNRKQTEEMAPAAERVISNPAGKDLEYDATSPLGNPGEEGQFHPTSQEEGPIIAEVAGGAPLEAGQRKFKRVRRESRVGAGGDLQPNRLTGAKRSKEGAPEEVEAKRGRMELCEEIYCVPKAGLSPQRWRAPPDEMIKINVDGSFIPGHEGSGWGVIARDADGAVVAARAGRQERVEDAFGAEVYALAHAISCAAELGLVRVLFETDCTLLEEAMDFARVDA
ncbi:Glutamyl-tRNA reductase 1, chloroplastic [Hordeum vulgare]|nr:Glutamyl-tRNA reductase 1, chloroplastic [Hordeum vulgare]